MREAESILIAAQNIAIRTNYVEAKIDNKHNNYKCSETVYHIIGECSKRRKKKYKTRHDWVRKEINGELCKRLKFDYSDKSYSSIQNLF